MVTGLFEPPALLRRCPKPTPLTRSLHFLPSASCIEEDESMSEPDPHSQLTTALGLYASRLEQLVKAYYRDHQAKGCGNHCELCTEAERALASMAHGGSQPPL